jgi:hypothetical protein
MEKRRVILRINSTTTGGTHCIWRFSLRNAIWNKRTHKISLVKKGITGQGNYYYFLEFLNRNSLKYEDNTPVFIITQSYL